MGLEVETLQALKAIEVSGLGEIGICLAGHVIRVKKCCGLFHQGTYRSASLSHVGEIRGALTLRH